MRKLLMTLAILLATTLFIHHHAKARKPAVEPVTGLSIDNYEHVPPENARGYEWKYGTPKKIVPESTTKRAQKNLRPPEIEQESGNGFLSTIFILFIVLLPLAIWISLFIGLGKNRKLPEASENLPDNVTDLIKEKKDDENEDYKFPKAS
ncbi:MAG: hypothetical protein KAQ98_04665 [Bacteriovoracaceae bacterium]|nr:hypothetical protein [Bacteriovoracaceae bacterium]